MYTGTLRDNKQNRLRTFLKVPLSETVRIKNMLQGKHEIL